MSARLLRFEVYRSNYPSSELGERLDDLEARDHRAAKALAAERHRGIQVVVLPSSVARARVRVPTSLQTPAPDQT